MRHRLSLALLWIAGAGLAIYVGLIPVGAATGAPGLLLWPYPWLWGLVIPTVGAFLAGIVLTIPVRASAAAVPIPPTTPPEAGLRIATPWHTYGDLQAHPNILTGGQTIKWTSNRAVAGTLRPEGRGFRAFGVEGMDLGYVETEREGVELIERWASGPSVAGS